MQGHSFLSVWLIRLFLDGQYTAFGEVVSGLELVDRVVAAKRDGRDNPLERIEVTVAVSS